MGALHASGAPLAEMKGERVPQGGPDLPFPAMQVMVVMGFERVLKDIGKGA